MFNLFSLVWLTIAGAVPVPQSILNATSNPVAKFFDFNQPGSSAEIIKFYDAWSGTLHTRPLFWVKVIGGLCSFLAQTLYAIAHSVEQVFNSMFGLFDILKISEITGNGRFAKLHMVLLLIACALLLVSLALVFITMIMGNRNGLHEVAQSIFTGLIVIVMLPAAVGWLGSFGQAATKDLNSVDATKSGKISSTALEPFRANTIDLLKLANDNFNTDPNKIGGSAGMAKYNDLTDANLNSTPFTDIVAGDNIKALKDAKNGNVFKYQVQPGIATAGKAAPENLMDLSFPSKQFGITMVMDSVYPRYIVNWWLILIEEIVLAVVFVLLAIKLAKSIFEIVTLTMIAPVVAFGRLSGSKTIKTLITTMIGAVMGIVTEVVTVKLFLIVVNYLPQSSVLSGLGSGWGKGIATVVVYVGAFFAMFTGINWIEQWLGTPTGSNAEGRNVLAAFSGGAAVGHGIGKLAGGASAAGSAVTGGIKRLLGGTGDQDSSSEEPGSGVLNHHNDDVGSPQNAADNDQADTDQATTNSASTGSGQDGQESNPDSPNVGGGDGQNEPNSWDTDNGNGYASDPYKIPNDENGQASLTTGNDAPNDGQGSESKDETPTMPVENLGDEDAPGGLQLDDDTPGLNLNPDGSPIDENTNPAANEYESNQPGQPEIDSDQARPQRSGGLDGYGNPETPGNVNFDGRETQTPNPTGNGNAGNDALTDSEETGITTEPNTTESSGIGADSKSLANSGAPTSHSESMRTDQIPVSAGTSEPNTGVNNQVPNPTGGSQTTMTRASSVTSKLRQTAPSEPNGHESSTDTGDSFPSAHQRLRDLGDLKK
ncbi:hypothetical protein LbDm2_2466 [Levilactobacillus brevis]|uniref:pLS20_p028 family conjugation system transmembrane protein n=1 Tax=Levilactobacillus brevis TaxID=1580 RepID=UPI00058019D7|nr:hypothetical protein [Levilactobacillus brevis]KID42561.1 hypothetical protein LbDm2_2466 [Levilactobacillus brevis]